MRELGPPPTVLPSDYDVNACCEFHSGPLEHSIENCKALKYKVQEMIDSNAIMFVPNGLNINNNLKPPRDKTNVNVVELDSGRNMITSIDDLKTPLV